MRKILVGLGITFYFYGSIPIALSQFTPYEAALSSPSLAIQYLKELSDLNELKLNNFRSRLPKAHPKRRIELLREIERYDSDQEEIALTRDGCIHKYTSEKCLEAFKTLIENLEQKHSIEFEEDVARLTQNETWFSKLSRSTFIKWFVLGQGIFNALIVDTQKSLHSAPQISKSPEEDLLLPSQQLVSLGKASPAPIRADQAELYWPHRFIDADLMNQRVNELVGTSASSSPVIVFDTGIDPSMEPYLSSASSINHRRFPQQLSKSTGKTVSNGHGTKVASILAGKGQVGVVQNGIQIISYNFVDSNVDIRDLPQSVLEVCMQHSNPKRITLINLSLSDTAEEEDPFTQGFEFKYPHIAAALPELGCLVVKASGNSGQRANLNQPQPAFDLDDSILRVQATNRFGRIVTFSSDGEISAPGADLPAFEVHPNRQKKEKVWKCSIDGQQTSPQCVLESGTSVAAPEATGVILSFAQILENSAQFLELSGRQKIKLINRIVKLSEVFGNINGRRAVGLAEKWLQMPTSSRFSFIQDKNPMTVLIPHLNEHPFEICHQDLPTCSSLSEDNEISSCLDLARTQLVLCAMPEVKNSKLAQVAGDISTIRTQKNEVTEAFKWAQASKQLGGKDDLYKKTGRKLLEVYSPLTGGQGNNPYEVNFEYIDFLIDFCSSTAGACNNDFLSKHLGWIISAWNVKISDHRHHTFDLIEKLSVLAHHQLGQEKVLNLLSSAMHAFKGQRELFAKNHALPEFIKFIKNRYEIFEVILQCRSKSLNDVDQCRADSQDILLDFKKTLLNE